MSQVGTRPAKCDTNWPIVHLNGAAARSTTLLNGSGGDSSHWITGYQLDGALATADGFYLLRRNCVYFNTTDAWTAADTGTTFDWGTEAANGDFSLEVWVNIPAATGAHATLMKRGDPASDGWLLEVTSAGLPKFTAHDSAAAMTITGTTNIFNGWHLITVTAERASTTGLNIYVDGVLDQSTPVTTAALDLDMDGGSTIVSTGVSGKDTWLGPVGIYVGTSALLSAATVLANYNGGIGRKYDGSETGLVAGFNNDEGVGTACYNILSPTTGLVALSGATWSPSKQDGSTAAQTRCGPPFETKGENVAVDQIGYVGKFGTGILTTSGNMNTVCNTFPQAIRIGKNNPVRILETDGAFSLILFGYTE